MKKLFVFLNLIRLWPHVLCYACSKNKKHIAADVEAYNANYKHGSLLWFLTFDKSFRTLFYHRLGGISNLISWLAPGQVTLTIPKTTKVGDGVLLFHSYGTILNAREIGEGCRIVCNITLGDKKGKTPIIGKHVEILPGAVIAGDVTIGDNCVIGPNAVVFKSVPTNCVVVGNPAYILKRDGVVVNEKL